MIVAMFLLVQLVGIYIAVAALSIPSLSTIRAEISSPQTVLLSYVLDVLLLSIGLVILTNRHPFGFLSAPAYLTLKMAVLVAASFFFFISIYCVAFPYFAGVPVFLIALGSSVLLVAANEFLPRFRNAVTVSSGIGVGLLLGMYLNFTYALVVIAIVALYDFVAVFIARPPAPSRAQFGEGDLGLPLMVSISAYYTFQGTVVPLLVVLGAAIGLLLAVIPLKKYKRPLPAMPPMFTFVALLVLGYVVFSGGVEQYLTVALLSTLVVLISLAPVLIAMARARRVETK